MFYSKKKQGEKGSSLPASIKDWIPVFTGMTILRIPAFAGMMGRIHLCQKAGREGLLSLLQLGTGFPLSRKASMPFGGSKKA